MTQKEKDMPHPLDVKGAASEKRWQQSKHGLFQPVPITIAFVAISTGGKTSQMLTVANAILPIMERVVIFSHSHRLDPAYIDLTDKLKQKTIRRGETPEAHPFVYDSLTHLPRVLSEQRERAQEAKDNNSKAHIPQLLIILDDMLGEMNPSKVLDSVITRGRHYGVSVLASTQVYRGLSSAMRKNFAAWAIGRMPMIDYKAFEEEHSGTYVTKEQLRELYDRAVGEQYGFLFYKPRTGDPENMFYSKFTTRLIPS